MSDLNLFLVALYNPSSLEQNSRFDTYVDSEDHYIGIFWRPLYPYILKTIISVFSEDLYIHIFWKQLYIHIFWRPLYSYFLKTIRQYDFINLAHLISMLIERLGMSEFRGVVRKSWKNWSSCFTRPISPISKTDDISKKFKTVFDAPRPSSVSLGRQKYNFVVRGKLPPSKLFQKWIPFGMGCLSFSSVMSW